MAKKKEDVKEERKSATRKTIVDFNLLSDEDKAKLKEKAAERISEQLREEAEDEYLEQAMRDERRKHTRFAHELKRDEVEITIDLPDFAGFLSTNGQRYYQNFTYKVERHVYNDLIERCARAWEHQSEIEGKPKHYYQKKRNPILGKRAA